MRLTSKASKTFSAVTRRTLPTYSWEGKWKEERTSLTINYSQRGDCAPLFPNYLLNYDFTH